jgi:hypothetical protein
MVEDKVRLAAFIQLCCSSPDSTIRGTVAAGLFRGAWGFHGTTVLLFRAYSEALQIKAGAAARFFA